MDVGDAGGQILSVLCIPVDFLEVETIFAGLNELIRVKMGSYRVFGELPGCHVHSLEVTQFPKA